MYVKRQVAAATNANNTPSRFIRLTAAELPRPTLTRQRDGESKLHRHIVANGTVGVRALGRVQTQTLEDEARFMGRY